MTKGLLLLFENKGGDFGETLDSELELVSKFDGIIDTVWVSEHHCNPLKLNPNPLWILTYLARNTNLNLGTATLLLAFYDPLYIAEAISLLSNLTDKKLLIGVAKGGRSEVKNSHLCLSENLAREKLIQNLNLVNQLLNNEEIDLNSKEIKLSPKAKIKPQFLVASLNEEVIKFSAQHSLPLMAGDKWSLSDIENLKQTYKNYHPQQQEPELILSRLFYPTKNKKSAIQEIKSNIALNRKKVSKFNKTHEPKEINDEVYKDSLIGDLIEYKEKLEFFKEFGVTHLILKPAFKELKKSLKGYA